MALLKSQVASYNQLGEYARDVGPPGGGGRKSFQPLDIPTFCTEFMHVDIV